MSNPTKLGQVLLAVFPKTMNRLIMLSDLRDQSMKIRAKWNMLSNAKNDKLKYNILSEYYVVAEKFHNNKYFWMEDLKIITK